MENVSQIPQWFHGYAVENERQHRELGERISGHAVENERQHRELGERISDMESRLIKWIVGTAIAFSIAAAAFLGAGVGLASVLID